MIRIEGKTFDHALKPEWKTHVVSDLELHQCMFENWSLPPRESFSECHVIRNVTAVNCSQANCFLWTTIVEDVVIDKLMNYGRGPLFTWACLFKQVTLRGKLSGFKFNQSVGSFIFNSQPQKPWDDAARAYYETVDWALDISEAEFQSVPDFHCLPGRLIRRDPETQVLVTRQNAIAANWETLDWDESALRLGLQWFLEDGLYDEVVLIAAKRAKYFRQDLRTLQMLRREGVAISD